MDKDELYWNSAPVWKRIEMFPLVTDVEEFTKNFRHLKSDTKAIIGGTDVQKA